MLKEQEKTWPKIPFPPYSAWEQPGSNLYLPCSKIKKIIAWTKVKIPQVGYELVCSLDLNKKTKPYTTAELQKMNSENPLIE